MFIFASELFYLLTIIITIMEKLSTIDVYFCKLSGVCKELYLIHALVRKSYKRLILYYLESSRFMTKEDKDFWNRFVNSSEDWENFSFEDWFNLIQHYKFWCLTDLDYLSTAYNRLSLLVNYLYDLFKGDLPF